MTFLQDELWPQIPVELLGTVMTKEEEERILGYGESGVCFRFIGYRSHSFFKNPVTEG